MKVIVIAIAAVLALLLSMGISGCSDPCANHGGTHMIQGGWHYCNDGSVQA